MIIKFIKCHLYNIESFIIYNLYKILAGICHKLAMQHSKLYEKYEKCEKEIKGK